ncbi:hypothetical protein OG216_47715 (plasmid) [Streptomycetaceae bacterium NBC_01309]
MEAFYFTNGRANNLRRAGERYFVQVSRTPSDDQALLERLYPGRSQAPRDAARPDDTFQRYEVVTVQVSSVCRVAYGARLQVRGSRVELELDFRGAAERRPSSTTCDVVYANTARFVVPRGSFPAQPDVVTVTPTPSGAGNN